MSDKLATNVRDTVLRCLIQLAKREPPSPPDEDDNLVDVLDLDSMDGVELAVDLAGLLDIEIPNNENPLVIDDTGGVRLRTLRELVTYVEDKLDQPNQK